MKNHEPEHEKEREARKQRETAAAYRGIHSRLEKISDTEALRDKHARKRTGVISPVRTFGAYGRASDPISPALDAAMQRLWDFGSTNKEGRIDIDLRRAYNLITRGRAPLTEGDVVVLAALPDQQLRLVLPWISHRNSLAEALEHVSKDEIAPPVVAERLSTEDFA